MNYLQKNIEHSCALLKFYTKCCTVEPMIDLYSMKLVSHMFLKREVIQPRLTPITPGHYINLNTGEEVYCWAEETVTCLRWGSVFKVHKGKEPWEWTTSQK